MNALLKTLKHWSGMSLVIATALVQPTLSYAADAVLTEQDYITKARKIYIRLSGRKPKITEPKFLQMVELLKSGKDYDAAVIASGDSGFVNNTLRLFAAPIHNASQSYRQTGLSESMAYIMGKIRDRARIEEILTGKDYYVPDLTGVTCNAGEEVYRCADRLGLDLSTKLVRAATPARPIYKSSTTKVSDTVTNRDTQPATLPNGDMDRSGIFTMDGFGYAGLQAGTNRRILQQLFNTVYRLKNDDLRASSGVSDKWVGPDISRDPEGTGLAVYQAQCRTCHGATFDGMRGAFAYFTAMDGNETNTRNSTILVYDNTRVDPKYARNANTYPNGYRTTNNSWEIMWTASQLAQFGYDGSGPTSGFGVAGLAQALTHFSQFQAGMLEKVIELVCPIDPNLTAQGKNQLLGDDAKKEFIAQLQGHGDLRKIFEQVAIRPECLGK